MPAISAWPHYVHRPIDPDAVLDYTIDWSDWLGTGESIIDASWTVTGADLLRSSHTTSTATAWLSGAATLVTATCQIGTDSSPTARVDQRTLIIQVEDR
jgi:hypothetical protein